MDQSFFNRLESQLQDLKKEGLYKQERAIASAQRPRIRTQEGQEVINLCANNYLGLAGDPRLTQAAQAAVEQYGFGMASVRFICGTQTVHRDLEQRLSQFLGTEDTILYSSCFDANGGLFETLLSEEDAVISDALNHASIIDGIRLCKAKRFRYQNRDLNELEQCLKDSQAARTRLIVTDGVFSMDGTIAPLKEICDLAERYHALVAVDDSHATGFLGAHGRGSIEHCGVMGRVDIITSTLGKALGGAAGGFVSARKPVIDWLRQRSRPYLFSNSLAPVIAATTIKVLELIEQGDALRASLKANAELFRSEMTQAGFTLIPGEHPIIPVMLFDAPLAVQMSNRLLELGLYVIGFSFPVVPKGQARIRTQMSAAHSREDILNAVKAFKTAGTELKLIQSP
jgi:glycine C-acetyltransferase